MQKMSSASEHHTEESGGRSRNGAGAAPLLVEVPRLTNLQTHFEMLVCALPHAFQSHHHAMAICGFCERHAQPHEGAALPHIDLLKLHYHLHLAPPPSLPNCTPFGT